VVKLLFATRGKGHRISKRTEILKFIKSNDLFEAWTVWPSGLRRWLQAPVRKGVGSNPTAVTFHRPMVFDIATGLLGVRQRIHRLRFSLI
jgi:hypothetical protein